MQDPGRSPWAVQPDTLDISVTTSSPAAMKEQKRAAKCTAALYRAP